MLNRMWRQRVFHLIVILMVSLSAVAQNSRSPHHNINVVILGDSNTWLAGDACNVDKGWSYWFKKRFAPATCISYSRSGATWTNTSTTSYDINSVSDRLDDNNVIYNQVNRLTENVKDGRQVEPQLIIISAGTNDAWFKDKRPGVFSETVTDAFQQQSFITQENANTILSLAKSVRYCCEMLMQEFPDAQIILLSPLQSCAVPEALISATGDIIEQCGNRMGINVIRQDKCCSVYDIRENQSKCRTYDGTHTSREGAKRNGYYLANVISNILEF